VAQGFLVEVDVHPAGEGEGHHQHRARQVVGAHVRVDAALEAIASAMSSGKGPELPMQVAQP